MTPRGFIALQIHGIKDDKSREGAQVRWRNLRIKEAAPNIDAPQNALTEAEKAAGWRLLWDGKNMQFTNIGTNEKIRVVTSNKFEVVNGDPKFDTKYDTIPALATAEEWIRHTYRDGWEQI